MNIKHNYPEPEIDLNVWYNDTDIALVFVIRFMLCHNVM